MKLCLLAQVPNRLQTSTGSQPGSWGPWLKAFIFQFPWVRNLDMAWLGTSGSRFLSKAAIKVLTQASVIWRFDWGRICFLVYSQVFWQSLGHCYLLAGDISFSLCGSSSSQHGGWHLWRRVSDKMEAMVTLSPNFGSDILSPLLPSLC